MNIIEGIDEEIKELVDTRILILSRIKALSEARDVISAPMAAETITRKINLGCVPLKEDKCAGKIRLKALGPRVERAEREKSPKKFLNIDYRGMNIFDSSRKIINQIDESFRERDISRLIFTYDKGMDLNRCHSACATAITKLCQLGEIVRLEPGLYQKIRS